MRGGCVLEALEHYFRLFAGTIGAETNHHRAPLVVHADSSAQLLPSIGKAPPGFTRAVRQLGYAQEDFASDFLSSAPSGSILIYAPWADISVPIYRHKAEGFALPVDVDIYTDLTRITDGELSDALEHVEANDADKEWVREIVAVLRSDYHYEPRMSVDAAVEIMHKMFNRIPDGARLFVVLPHEWIKWNGRLAPRTTAIEYNAALRKLARGYPSVTALDMNDIVAGPDDIQMEFDHFARVVYFRLFQRIMTEAGADATQSLPEMETRLSSIEA